MSKILEFTTLLSFILGTIVGFRCLEQSALFHKVILNGTKWSSLQRYLYLKTTGPSVIHCAHSCVEQQACLSFLMNQSSGACQLFSVGVDIRFKELSGTMTLYTKKVTCEDFGYVTLNSTNKCLKHHNALLSWMDANNTCVSEGGNLFSITSLDMMAEVFNVTYDKDAPYTIIHIDGNDLSQEGNWSYHDGSYLTLISTLNWTPTEPNGGTRENCLCLINGKFCDAPCDQSSKFVCERYFLI